MDSQANYPIIKIPYSIKNALEKNASLPLYPQRPNKPTEPEKPKQMSGNKKGDIWDSGCITLFVLAVIILPIVALALGSYTYGIFGILVAVALLWVIYISRKSHKEETEKSIREYPQKLSQYQSDFAKYNRDISTYDQRLRDYENEVSRIVDSYESVVVRRNEVAKALNVNRDIIRLHSTPTVNKTGKSEDAFYENLSAHFGNSIKRNLGFRVGKSENLFVPDFIYDDSVSHMIMDIEIDEPYEIETGKPIHFIGSDESRDSYFERLNFIIVRFAEEQVVKYPEECCGFLENLISAVKNGTRYDKIKIQQNFEKIPQWTEEESHQMAYQHYRDSYIL